MRDGTHFVNWIHTLAELMASFFSLAQDDPRERRTPLFLLQVFPPCPSDSNAHTDDLIVASEQSHQNTSSAS